MIAVASRSFSAHKVLRAELLAKHAEVRFNDDGRSLRGADLVSFLDGCDKAILALERVDDALLAQLPGLKVVSKFGVGLDSFDLAAMAKHGVKLAWTPGTNSRSVSELALMLILSCLRRAAEAQADLRAGNWKQLKGATLSGKTVGLVGFGAVARDLAALLVPFGVRLLAHDPFPDRAAAETLGVRLVALEELLVGSDAVSVHAALTHDTKGLLDAGRLSMMKPSAVLVNTARGGLVDEEALLAALDAGRLAGAGLDVYAVEPPKDSRLVGHPKVTALPHLGGSTEEAILAMGRAAIAGLDDARDALSFKR